MRRKSVFIIFFLLAPVSAFSTSIVAVRSPGEIVIGADSSTTLTRIDNESENPKCMEKCKIVQAGDVFFASAGFAGVGPARRPGSIYPEFNLKKIIIKGLASKGTINAKLDNLEKTLVMELSGIAGKAKKDSPAFFVEKFARRPLFTLIIAGLEDGIPVLMVRTFRLKSLAEGAMSFDVERFSCPGDCRSPSIAIFAGETGAIRQYLSEKADVSSAFCPIDLVRNLVGLEISNAPSAVGPPVDILRLTGSGPEWIQKKAICPDIER